MPQLTDLKPLYTPSASMAASMRPCLSPRLWQCSSICLSSAGVRNWLVSRLRVGPRSSLQQQAAAQAIVNSRTQAARCSACSQALLVLVLLLLLLMRT